MYIYEQLLFLIYHNLPVNDMISHGETKFEVVPINEETTTEKKESIVFIEQFVKDVCDFSSQYGSNISISYTAYNIAGNPSKFPDYGDFPQAFVMVCFMIFSSLFIIVHLFHSIIVI